MQTGIADILFIAADPREFAGAIVNWKRVRPLEKLGVHWARQAEWRRKKIVAIANGAGPQRAAMAARAYPHRVLVNVGFCGALDPKLKVGDIVVGDWWLQPRAKRPYTSGRIASIPRVAQTAEEKRKLRETGAIVVEMEAGGLENVPCYCIKVVSDLAEESFANNFNAVLEPDGRMNVGKLLLFTLLNPFSRIPELKRLYERSQVASQSLGDFLESCDF